MLTESKKQDLQEMTNLLKGLDNISMLIIKSNTAALLARQELEESRMRKQAHDQPQMPGNTTELVMR